MEFWNFTNQTTNYTKEKLLNLGFSKEFTDHCSCGKKAVGKEARSSHIKTKPQNLRLKSVPKTLANALTLKLEMYESLSMCVVFTVLPTDATVFVSKCLSVQV